MCNKMVLWYIDSNGVELSDSMKKTWDKVVNLRVSEIKKIKEHPEYNKDNINAYFYKRQKDALGYEILFRKLYDDFMSATPVVEYVDSGMFEFIYWSMKGPTKKEEG